MSRRLADVARDPTIFPFVRGVCRRCRDGKHNHDRFTDTGADAGCPWSEDGTTPCACRYVQNPVIAGRCPTCGHPEPDTPTTPTT